MKESKDYKLFDKLMKEIDPNKEKFIEIKRIPKLKKGDIAVLRMKGDVTGVVAGYLIKILEKNFPDNKCLVLCNDMDLFPLPKKMLNSMGWYEQKKLVNKIIK